MASSSSPNMGYPSSVSPDAVEVVTPRGEDLAKRRGLGNAVLKGKAESAESQKSGSRGSRGFTKLSAMEDIDEGQFLQQVESLVGVSSDPQCPERAAVTGLPAGGKFDALLEPGKAMELLKTLPQIFADNPPPPQQDIFGPAYAARVFSPSAVATHLQSCNTWDPSPAGNVEHIIVTANTRLMIVGDTHGQLEDVLWLFTKYGEPSSVNRYLFNGDYVDRGGHSLEIILLLLALKRENPDGVYMLRGNHEDTEANIHFGFQQELYAKFSDSRIFHLCGSLWSNLPIMAHITNSKKGCGFVVVHGGIPNSGPDGPLTVDKVKQIDRCQKHVPMQEKDLWGLLWQDPDFPKVPSRGANAPWKPFTEKDTLEFCEANNLRAIVRSHMVKRQGWEACHKYHCFTIFSASNYTGHHENHGAVAIIQVDDTNDADELSFDINRFSAAPFKYIAQMVNQKEARIKSSIKAYEKYIGLEEPAPPPIAAPLARAESTDTVDAEVEEALKKSLQLTQTYTKNKETQNWASFVQAVIDLIVLCKPALRGKFEGLDLSQTGTVSKAQWSQLLMNALCQHQEHLVTIEELEGDLFRHWGLSEPVNYIQFLSRFQVASRLQDQLTGKAKTAGRATEMLDARKKFENLDAHQLVQALDPNGDEIVTSSEFVGMLSQFKVDIPASQAHTMYEDFRRNLKCKQLSIDHMLYCLACIGHEIPPAHEHEKVVTHISSLLQQKGINLAQAFRMWDKSKDGYLQEAEIKEGLGKLLDEAIEPPRKGTDVTITSPNLAQVQRLLHQAFDPEFLEGMIPMPPDMAIQVLTQNKERYAGYQRDGACPGLLRFAKKGATIHPQVGCTVTIIDTESETAATKQVEIPEEPDRLVDSIVLHLRSCCNDINKVNILEFIRGTVPRGFIASLKKVMLRDILRRVWMCKAALQIVLSHRDEMSTGELSLADFKSCITGLSQTLKSQGANTMTENHILAVCDVAACGSDVVNYKQFLAGLFVVDADGAEPVDGGD